MLTRRAKQAALLPCCGPGEWMKCGKDPPGTEVRSVSEEVGCGVFAVKEYEKGEFILEYPGDLKSPAQFDVNDKTFVYYFKHNGKNLCIDATYSERKGKYINDEWIRPNAVVKKIVVDNSPRLGIFALMPIPKETEIRFDYGDKTAPWRKKEHGKEAAVVEGINGLELGDGCELEKDARNGDDCDFKGKLRAGSGSDGCDLQVQRWQNELQQILNQEVATKKVGHLLYSKSFKIANGSNGSQIFVGFFNSSVPVAVKRLTQEFHAKEQEVNEILSRQTNLKHILKAIVVEEDEDFTYVATPLCNFNLEELIENKDLPQHKSLTHLKRLDLCVQLVYGINELHHLGILHRDLKPTNVLIDASGNVLVADFGVSRQLKTGTTLFTKAIGTLCWMSTESLTGDIAKYKKSSDVQMMGCLIYYILSDGHIPHETGSPYQKDLQGVLKNVKEGTFSLKHLNTKFHHLRPLLHRMLCAQENYRPSSEECLSYFRDIEAGEDTSLPSSSKSLPSFCLATTGIGSKKKEKVQLLAQVTRCKLSETVNDLTTHVITSTDANEKYPITLKFLQGVAQGLWVMEFAWVTESLKHGYLLPEELFESHGEDGGPYRARLWKGTPLLQDVHVTVMGNSTYMPKEQLLQLLCKCGATVDEEAPVIVDLGGPERRGRTRLPGVTVVNYYWAVDTIYTYRVQPYETYKVSSKQTDPEMGGNSLHEETGDQADVMEQPNNPSEAGTIENENLCDTDLGTDGPLDPDYQPPDDELTNGVMSKNVTKEAHSEPSMTNTGEQECSSFETTGEQADVMEQPNNSNEAGTIENENLCDTDLDTDDPLDPDYQPPDDELTNGVMSKNVTKEAHSEPSMTNIGEQECSSFETTGEQADVMEQPNNSNEADIIESESLSDTDTEDPLDPDYQPLDDTESLPNDDELTNGVISMNLTKETLPEPSMTNTGEKECSSFETVSDREDGDELEDSAQTFVLDSNSTRYSYCLYCSLPQRKLPRHCARKHRKELLVEEALAECNDAAKRAKWLHIRKLGNHEHNNLVFSGKAKDLVVRRRPTQSLSSIFSYVPCLHCYGYYHRQSLWVHAKNCPKKSKGAKVKTNHVKEGLKLIESRSETSPALKLLLSKMVHDKVSLIIRNDENILKVGEITLSTSNSRRKGDKAREKMRLLAKLLEQARSLDPEIKHAQGLVHPRRFELVVSAAKLVSGYDEEKQTHKSYSCALNIGFAVSDLAMVVKSNYVKNQLHEKVTEVDGFIYLRSTEWRSRIIAPAHRQKQEMAWRAPKLIPLTEDCVKFNLYLKVEEKKVKAEIEKDGTITFSTYKRFASVTLAQIILYNRRRPSEVAEITVSDYKDQTTKEGTIHDEVMESLSAPEKISLQRSTLLMVRGKRGRGVPILLPQNLKESTDMLALYNSGKKYLFSRTGEGSETPLRAYQVIADLAKEPDLQDPASIRCTKLRKHLATMSQLLSLRKNELEQLANHLGHDVSTHREYYRLPSETILLAKMSKLLSLAEEGRLHEFKDKSLHEVSVAEDELVTSNANAEESDSPEQAHSDEQVEIHEETETDASNKAENQSFCVKSNKKKKIRLYNRWTEEQERFLTQQKEVQILLKAKRVPGKTLCTLLINRSNGILSDKRWQHVKNKVHNINTTEKSKLKKRTITVV